MREAGFLRTEESKGNSATPVSGKLPLVCSCAHTYSFRIMMIFSLALEVVRGYENTPKKAWLFHPAT